MYNSSRFLLLLLPVLGSGGWIKETETVTVLVLDCSMCHVFHIFSRTCQ